MRKQKKESNGSVLGRERACLYRKTKKNSLNLFLLVAELVYFY